MLVLQKVACCFDHIRAMSSSAVVVAVVLVASCGMVSAESRHKVGGSLGWYPGNNFTEWARNEKVYAGDWLLFVFDKLAYDVLEVNQTSYDNCDNQGFIANVTRGGRDVYQLKEAKTYYFICGKGHCWNGMKVAVNVSEPPPAPAPAPANSSAYTNLLRGKIGWSGVVVVMIASWVLCVISL